MQKFKRIGGGKGNHGSARRSRQLRLELLEERSLMAIGGSVSFQPGHTFSVAPGALGAGVTINGDIVNVNAGQTSASVSVNGQITNPGAEPILHPLTANIMASGGGVSGSESKVILPDNRVATFSMPLSGLTLGNHSFSFTLNVGGTRTVSGLLPSSVRVNARPVALADTFGFAEQDQPYTDNVKTNDHDGDSADADQDGNNLTVVSETKPTAQGGSVVISTNGNFVYTPANPDFNGVDSFGYTLSDGAEGGTVLVQPEVEMRGVEVAYTQTLEHFHEQAASSSYPR